MGQGVIIPPKPNVMPSMTKAFSLRLLATTKVEASRSESSSGACEMGCNLRMTFPLALTMLSQCILAFSDGRPKAVSVTLKPGYIDRPTMLFRDDAMLKARP